MKKKRQNSSHRLLHEFPANLGFATTNSLTHRRRPASHHYWFLAIDLRSTIFPIYTLRFAILKPLTPRPDP
ncbi:hypothetical protein J0J21_23260, partial [Vibrio vulnificus]|nr:hypothetical protein [Vibrio vulnificus]